MINLYSITTCLIYRIYIRKNHKERHPKMVTYPRRSLATNPTNIEILLQSTSNRITSRLPVDLHSIFNWLPHDRL
jgi:hypothetical protein